MNKTKGQDIAFLGWNGDTQSREELARMIDSVIAQEREDCAKIAEDCHPHVGNIATISDSIAERIRKRGNLKWCEHMRYWHAGGWWDCLYPGNTTRLDPMTKFCPICGASKP